MLSNAEIFENISKAKELINYGEPAFIIGNGIHLYYRDGDEDNSWDQMLKILWRKVARKDVDVVPEGISLTEFYDALEISCTSDLNNEGNIQKSVCKLLSVEESNPPNKVLRKIKIRNLPILTTNFDNKFQKSLNLDFYMMRGKSRTNNENIKQDGFTDFYPWECYYSDREILNSLDGFAIWHINGMIKYHRSIKLGLSHYMGNVSRAFRYIKGDERHIYQGKNQSFWKGYNTWLHIIFNRDLFIVGLGLKESEVFLRWLLIERAKYYKKFPSRKKEGWYIQKADDEKDKNIGKGRKFFLNSVGINVIELPDYQSIYEGIWE